MKRILAPLLMVVALAGQARAQIPPISATGVRISTSSSTPIPGGSRGIWVDSSGRLRFDEGSRSDILPNILPTAKGDLAVFSGVVWLQLGVGSDGQILMADSSQAGGIKWAAPPQTGHTLTNNGVAVLPSRLNLNVDGTILNFADDGVGATNLTAPGLVPKTRTLTAGAGLTGLGDLSADRSVSIATGGVTNSMLANSSLSVLAGAGLTGGGTVSLGGSTTLSLPDVGTAGTYTQVTTDAKGRVTSGSNPGFITSRTLQQAYNDGTTPNKGAISLLSTDPLKISDSVTGTTTLKVDGTQVGINTDSSANGGALFSDGFSEIYIYGGVGKFIDFQADANSAGTSVNPGFS